MKRYTIIVILFLSIYGKQMLAVEVYAHRGLAAYWPENTLVSFEKSLELGVDALDIDVALTKDNIVVGSHDPFLNKNLTRDKNGHWLKNNKNLIRNYTFKDLQQFDVGAIKRSSTYRLQFAKQKELNNIKIPSLAQVIELIKSKAKKETKLQIEIKTHPIKDSDQYIETFVESIISTLNKHNFIEKAELQSYDWRTLVYAKKIEPKAILSFITEQSLSRNVFSTRSMPAGKGWTAGYHLKNYDNSIIKTLVAAGANNWCPFYKNVTKELVKQAHENNIRVIPWTADSKSDMKKLISMGVDGIITNKADVLLQILNA